MNGQPSSASFDSVSVNGFRGFADLTVAELARVNLITGANNVGKTAFLESIFLLLGAHNPDVPLRLNHFRGMDLVTNDAETWGWLFHAKEMNRVITIHAKSQYNDYTLSIAFQPSDIMLAASDVPTRPPVSTERAGTTAPTSRSLSLTLQRAGAVIAYSSVALLPSGQVRLSPSPEPPPFPNCTYQHTRHSSAAEDAQRFGTIEEDGLQGELIEILRHSDARVKSLSVYSMGATPALRADLGTGRLIPLQFVGQGFSRLVSIVLSIMTSRNGCVLIDEFDNGLHYAALPGIWRGVAETANRANVQVFATTHSRECVIAAHGAFKERLAYELAVLRLERTNDHVRVVRYSQDALDTATSQNWELR